MSKHALYSPSSAERWVNCPASINLSKDLPPEPESDAARIGTNHHTLLEYLLKGEPITRGVKRDIGWTPEMQSKMETVVQKIEEEKAKAINPGNVTFISEHKTRLDHLVGGDMSGTSDVVIAEEFATLHVQDYKNGKKLVSPINNLQGLAYVLGVADEFNYNFENYKFSIIQPTATGNIKVRTWTFFYRDLMIAKLKFGGAIAESKRKSPSIKDGPWCFFCPASKICPLKKEQKYNEAEKYFDEE